MGRQMTIYIDDETYERLESIDFGNSRSDKIRYAIRQLDPVMAKHHEALVIFKRNIDQFLADNDDVDERYWKHTFRAVEK